MRVCFIPGSLCDARLFAPQIAALSEQGHYCTVIDTSSQRSIEHMAGLVAAKTEPGVVLVGLSLGAIVAAELVGSRPDHVAAVALFDTNLDAPDQDQLDTRQRWAQRVRSGEFPSMVAEELTLPLTHAPRRHSEIIFTMAMAVGPQGFLNQNEALLHRHDRRDDLCEFAGPVLIGYGQQDRVCSPTLHIDLAQRIPRAELLAVDDAGHLATIDQAEPISVHLVDWLERCAHRNQTQEGTHEYRHA